CEKHLEPPKLFCEDDQVTFCVKCTPSQEHKHHVLYAVGEAVENYQKLFQEMLNTLRKKLEIAQNILADEQERMVIIQGLRDLRKEASLNQLIKLATELEEKPQEILQRLGDLMRDRMDKLKESEAWLSEQICSLQGVIAELEKKCGEPSVALLHEIISSKFEFEKCKLLAVLRLHIHIKRSFSMFSKDWLDLANFLAQNQRHITLDPETAHPFLVLYEDLRSVRFGNVQQAVPGHPGRFDFSATVLGVERFTSGRHYWEVDVGKAANWQLGVCRDSVSGQGGRPNAHGEKVLLTRSMMGVDCTFWVFPPLKRISLRQQMHRVGVFVDCEYGQVSFYNVTERSFIYSLSYLPFHGTVRPIFSICIPNEGTSSDSLTICPPQHWQ
uniref:B30.2/SPRY domain-containing protein n=1 Tax=Loxodonta africana TaxID=9785 RepID=G3STN8_LOXAF